jgi:ATP-dependent DNA ligase
MERPLPVPKPGLPILRAYEIAAAPRICAFDLLELDGRDLRGLPLGERRRLLARLIRKPRAGLVLNEQYDHDGPTLFEHACKLGCDIVSKRQNSRYRSGRSRDWVKAKNPAAPAVKREAEEDWGKDRWR